MWRERETRRYLYGFLVAFLLFAIIRNGTYFIEVTHERPYYFYMISQIGCFLLMACWMLSVQSRIIDKKVQKLLLWVGGLFLMYFTLQMVKYCLFTEDMDVGKYMWYAYYIPMTMIPLTVCYTLHYLSSTDTTKSEKKIRLLIIPAALISIGFLTNDIHELAFKIPNWYENGDKDRTLGPIYYIYIAFMAVLFVIGIISVNRMKWKVENKKKLLLLGIPLLIGIFYMIIYTLKPQWICVYKNKRVFEIAEVFALMIIGFVETCIQIGLIPSNIGYGKLFSMTDIPARVTDRNGKVFYETNGDEGGFPTSKNHRIVKTVVTGGSLYYAVDLTNLYRLNSKLDEATSILEARNEILRHENEITAEREKTDATIRIYDNITNIVRPWLVKIHEMLNEDCSEEVFRKNLVRSAVMNAYVKRRSNMELEAQKDGVLPFKELITAVTESLEYAKLTGMETFLSASGSGLCEPNQICNAYLAFENVIEAVLDKAQYMTVRLTLEDSICIRFLLNGDDGFEEISDMGIKSIDVKSTTEGNDMEISVVVVKGGD